MSGGEAWRAEEEAGGRGEAGWGRGARGAGRGPGPPETSRRCAQARPEPRARLRQAALAVLRAPPGTRAQRPSAAAPVASTADSCRREGRKAGQRAWGRGRPRRGTPGHRTRAPTRKQNENQKQGGPLCRLTETRLWGQELVCGVLHGTVPWSPAPASALRGEGRERGAQVTRVLMPGGGWGVRSVVQAEMTSFRDWASVPAVGDRERQGGAGVLKTTQRSSTEPGAGSGERVCALLLCFSARPPRRTRPSLTQPDKQSSALVLVR